MKVSTKGRYALRIMIDLAEHNTGGYIRLKDISKRQGITLKYMEQIMPILTKSGYVRAFVEITVVICWQKNQKNIQLERFYGQQKAVWLR